MDRRAFCVCVCMCVCACVRVFPAVWEEAFFWFEKVCGSPPHATRLPSILCTGTDQLPVTAYFSPYPCIRTS